MSAWGNVRMAIRALTGAQAGLASFVGGRDRKNPQNDALNEVTAPLIIRNAIREAENAAVLLREALVEIEAGNL